MKIRKIKPEDNTAIAAIIRSCFVDFNAPTKGTVFEDPTTDHLFEYFKAEPNSVFFVAEENEELLGCCGIYPTKNLPEGYAELVKFYIKKSARGKGLGKLLMEKSIEEAKQLGYQNIYIESLPEFSKAVSIYEKLGFKYLPNAMGNSGHSGCNIWMLKKIEI